MANINVHILNYHALCSHIEILLENTSVEPHTYLNLNRWARPATRWLQSDCFWDFDEISPESASSSYTFSIQANPNTILKDWRNYWQATDEDASILGDNCAVAAQWFLNQFADIPDPSLSNLSLNHLAFGIFWPSFIPCPVTLPGRIMSNAKFHIEARKHPEHVEQYSRLFLYTGLALALLTISASVFGLMLASSMANLSMALATATASIVGGAAGTYGFFETYHLLSAKNIVDDAKKNDYEPALQ